MSQVNRSYESKGHSGVMAALGGTVLKPSYIHFCFTLMFTMNWTNILANSLENLIAIVITRFAMLHFLDEHGYPYQLFFIDLSFS